MAARDIAIDELVEADRVDSRIYVDPGVFEAELERIFYRTWVYVGHDSEVPEVGDYALKRIGRQSVIMVRSEDGEIRLLMNRCRHRGSTVCQAETGNANFFRCQYHGWTYSNDGALLGVPRPHGYDDSFDKGAYGLTPVPRIGGYRGFVFASLASDGPALMDHLGNAAGCLDAFVEASPVGRISLRAGVQRTRYRGNWKYVGMDGYHATFTHKSVGELLSKRREELSAADAGPDTRSRDQVATFKEQATSHAVDLGNGHVQLHDDHSERKSLVGIIEEANIPTDAVVEYRRSMEEAYGPTFEGKIAAQDPHVGIFPNLQLIGVHVRAVHPVAADETEVEMYPALLEGVPAEVNTGRLRAHEWFFGPASFGSPDDGEIFERNQIGFQAEVEREVLLARGVHREEVDEAGIVRAARGDEVTQRGQLKQWRRLMEVAP